MTTSCERSSSAPPTEPDPFRHLAVRYDDVEGLLDAVDPLLDLAVARGDVVWAAVDDAVRDAIEDRLGDTGADVVFDEPARPYSYSGQTTAARRAARLAEVVGGDRAALILSDSVAVAGPGPRADAPSFWNVVDASCNLALAGLPVTLVCLCDAADASDDSDRFLSWNHPELLVDAVANPNPGYLSPDQVLAATPVPPAPPLGPPVEEQVFVDSAALRAVRRAGRRHALEAGLDDERTDGLLLAVCELVSNSIEHGPGGGTLSWWTEPGRLVAQIHDAGRMTTTTPGLRCPAVRSPRGRGVWLARQLTDVLHLWSTADGTHARLEISA